MILSYTKAKTKTKTNTKTETNTKTKAKVLKRPNMYFVKKKKRGFKDILFWVLSRPGPQTFTSRALTWIQCKLGKQYL